MKLKENHKKRGLDLYRIEASKKLSIPLADGGVSAGFPSPAQDFLDLAIDLNKELIPNPASTFYARVNGQSMEDMGIDSGDLVIIDKSLMPQNGKIAVCFLDGEFTMKTIKFDKDCCWLVPANKKFQPIKVTKDNDFIIWGIVIHVIKSF
ncbi:MAG: translesion error-prone DNA polymerase V autoproteolytic subunit [Flavobacteriales bacterium]|nr:translesion error-prone DNA polymerase V autoproteolytic subunit [Flavobacteriales bacterium]